MTRTNRRSARSMARGSVWTLLMGLCCLILYGGMARAYDKANSVDALRLHPPIPLLDEQGAHVADSGKPYSPKMSCGEGAGCHDYAKISHGYHTDMGLSAAVDDYGKKRGIGYMVSAGYYGGYNCMSGNNPGILAKKTNASEAELYDYGTPNFVRTCVGCHSGGGFAEFDRNGNRYDQMPEDKIPLWDGDYYSRDAVTPSDSMAGHGMSDPNTVVTRWDWKKSGVVEADCMLCHADVSALRKFPDSKFSTTATTRYTAQALFEDLREVKLVRGGFFRYADSAIFEFLDVKNTDPKAEPGLSLLTIDRTVTNATDEKGYTLKLGSDGLPKLTWNRAAFDQDGKVAIPMLRFPANQNCMTCHTTDASRRGFYGYADGVANYAQGSNGILVDNYKGDVHKGKLWTEDNGQGRVIDNCNACHSRNYFNPPYANVDLSADHNFPKGNADTDLRDDLDNEPPPKTCEHCHEDSPNRNQANPSVKGVATAQSITDVHQQRWATAGNLAGYPAASLAKITQTHMDVVGCQTCHITDVKSNGTPLTVLYRYQETASGQQKIVPYRPSVRYLWIDKTSGRTVTNLERASVIKKVYKADGKTVDYGWIIDPATGQQLAKVLAASASGNLSADEPYESYVAYKQAIDKLLAQKGYANPNSRAVWNEVNDYLIAHNARPSPMSLACADCHEKKQDGAYSALVSETGLFGGQDRGLKTVITKVSDKRLVDEGIMELAQPTMKLAPSGTAWAITQTVKDVLAASRSNPSMSIYNVAITKVASGEWRGKPLSDALDGAAITDAGQRQTVSLGVGSDPVYQFGFRSGDKDLRQMAIFSASNSLSDAIFSQDRLEIEVRDAGAAELQALAGVGAGTLASKVFRWSVTNVAHQPLSDLHSQTAVVKLPYHGTESDPKKVLILAVQGGFWSDSGLQPLSVMPETSLADGYVTFTVDKPFDALALVVKSSDSGGSATLTLKEARAKVKAATKAKIKAKKAARKAANAANKAEKAAVRARAKAERATSGTARADALGQAADQAEAKATQLRERSNQAAADLETAGKNLTEAQSALETIKTARSKGL